MSLGPSGLAALLPMGSLAMSPHTRERGRLSPSGPCACLLEPPFRTLPLQLQLIPPGSGGRGPF